MSPRVERFLTLYLPLGFFLFVLAVDKPFPHLLPGLTSKEEGLIETLHNTILFIAVWAGVALLWHRDLECPRWVKIWIGLGVAGALYGFLEEISYGQHIFHWNTPEYWKAYNDQHETNLHNTSSWLDQKPRLVLELGVLVGGIVVPLLRRFRPALLPQRLATILPDNTMLPVALMAILPRQDQRIGALFGYDDFHLFQRTSEMGELYVYYFILLYLLLIRRRVLRDSP